MVITRCVSLPLYGSIVISLPSARFVLKLFFYKFAELVQPLDIVIIKSELICVRLYMRRLLN